MIRTSGRPAYPFHLRDLLLAVEVTSPGRPFLGYQVKRPLYSSEGVQEYWVVGVEDRSITRWRGKEAAADVLTDRIQWAPPGSVESFAVDIPTLFDDTMR